MIEALKSDAIVNKVGGRFKLTALIQRRRVELMEGRAAVRFLSFRFATAGIAVRPLREGTVFP